MKNYAAELSRGVGSQKAMSRAISQAGAGTSKLGIVGVKASQAVSKLGASARGAANKLKTGFGKLSGKMAGMGKAVGGVTAIATAAVGAMQEFQQKQFDSAIKEGNTDDARAMAHCRELLWVLPWVLCLGLWAWLSAD